MTLGGQCTHVHPQRRIRMQDLRPCSVSTCRCSGGFRIEAGGEQMDNECGQSLRCGQGGVRDRWRGRHIARARYSAVPAALGTRIRDANGVSVRECGCGCGTVCYLPIVPRVGFSHFAAHLHHRGTAVSHLVNHPPTVCSLRALRLHLCTSLSSASRRRDLSVQRCGTRGSGRFFSGCPRAIGHGLRRAGVGRIRPAVLCSFARRARFGKLQILFCAAFLCLPPIDSRFASAFFLSHPPVLASFGFRSSRD
ncbi:hypothetical protein DFH06DRAFT_282110 [Mycena polygramma]|nr:hypothetical protein DFH06DRAFT_282110 [Mycena polygramma]